jgi:hypothetical protein
MLLLSRHDNDHRTENRNDHELLLVEGYYFSHMSESRKER